MKLLHLLESITVKNVFDQKEQERIRRTEITSIHYKSQDVRQGGMFVAIQGNIADGHEYIDAALSNGASAIVTQKPVERDSLIIEVEDTRKALSAMSASFCGNPSEKLFLIGITGTNGKTTTSYLIESILSKAGFSAGVIGTVNYRYAGKVFKSSVTTPESLDLQMILGDMLKHGVTHVVIEVSSHAIDQGRTADCWFDAGVFTNLTQDHLDYHKNMDSYWLCKKRLFTENLMSGPKKGRTVAVINCEDPRGRDLAGSLMENSMIKTFEVSENTVRPEKVGINPGGIKGRLSTPGGDFDFKSSLTGKYNLKNIMCATMVGIALDLPLDVIKAGIEDIAVIPGRLERVPNTAGCFVYVDYAHTPDALDNVLSSLRLIADKRIICVFGCGGDRDKDKRHQMGEIAGRLCDIAIVTSDNPRTEEPAKIIAQILEGVRKTSGAEYNASDKEKLSGQKDKRTYVVEPDRRKAIQFAADISGADDIMLIAGKGHETAQLIGSKIISFDDREEAEKAFLSRGN